MVHSHQHHLHHSAHFPVVEFVDTATEGTKWLGEQGEKLETALKAEGVAMRAATLQSAFRKYSWLHLAPVMNKSGNLRGIVINARARSIYNVGVELGEKAEKVGKVAGFLGGFAAVAFSLRSVYQETIDIVHSNDDNATKAGKLSTQLTSFSLRTIAGVAVIPEVHIILHGVAMIAGSAQKHLPSHNEGLSFIKEVAENSNATLDADVQHFTDGKVIYNYLQVSVQPAIDRRFFSRG